MTLDELRRHPAAAYVGPFVVFMALLAVLPAAPIPERARLIVWLLVPAAAVLWMSRGVLEFRPSQPVLSVLLGVAVCALWVAPDQLFPGWRQHWLFTNSITGSVKSSLGADALADPLALTLRSLRAILLVPVIEELFWRGWLMRWFAKNDFERVPLGTFERSAFLWVAVLFALEHGPFWDVGLATGLIYNWWMVRTKRLSDLILCHAVTNGCLCGFVLATGQWGYWL